MPSSRHRVRGQAPVAADMEDSDQLSSWLTQLAHDYRRAILERLVQGPATLSQLAQMLDVIPQTAHRHVQSLRSAGLIEGGDGGYRATPDARHVLEQTRNLRTLARLHRYFGRRLDALPAAFRARLGELDATQLRVGAPANEEALLDALAGARTRAWLMTRRPLDAMPAVTRAAAAGADVRILVPAPHAASCAALWPLRPQLRAVVQPPATLLVTEREAYLGLVDDADGGHLSVMLVARTAEARRFAHDLFDHAWSAAPPGVNGHVDAALSTPRR